MRPGASGERAQTTIDFAIGIGLFLIVVAFVVAFVPTIFTPFQSTEGPQTADRIATSLSTDRLGDPTEPYVVNETCTEGFFDQLNGGGPAPSTCSFNTSATTTREVFALDRTRDVNVTVRYANGSVVDSGVRLAAGPTPPETTSVASATRVVSLGERPRRLTVRTW
ncbi:DUF7287 family protein [Halobellus ruber]|uniref:Uncharacterized protein n=1 Tax=Halobellus ruber TaxID=2761102 RepID=A0A7J9SHE7_9EURY|nr:hypothetical protein [Halobellus ruber]MBB6646385.1 hypothetical protein [Halobellus ruber]